MANSDGSFKYAGMGGVGAGVGKPNKSFKGGFHLEPHLRFDFKLEHLASTLPKSTSKSKGFLPVASFCSH